MILTLLFFFPLGRCFRASSFFIPRKQIRSDRIASGGNPLGSSPPCSVPDPVTVPIRFPNPEFGFEFGFGTLSSEAANLPRTKNPKKTNAGEET